MIKFCHIHLKTKLIIKHNYNLYVYTKIICCHLYINLPYDYSSYFILYLYFVTLEFFIFIKINKII